MENMRAISRRSLEEVEPSLLPEEDIVTGWSLLTSSGAEALSFSEYSSNPYIGQRAFVIKVVGLSSG